jgi:hypothetical protein
MSASPGYVERNPGQPGPNLGWVAQVMQAEQRLQRSFLQDVFEAIVCSQPAPADAAHQRQVAGEQAPKCLSVARSSTLDQGRVGVGHRLAVREIVPCAGL